MYRNDITDVTLRQSFLDKFNDDVMEKLIVMPFQIYHMFWAATTKILRWLVAENQK